MHIPASKFEKALNDLTKLADLLDEIGVNNAHIKEMQLDVRNKLIETIDNTYFIVVPCKVTDKLVGTLKKVDRSTVSFEVVSLSLNLPMEQLEEIVESNYFFQEYYDKLNWGISEEPDGTKYFLLYK